MIDARAGLMPDDRAFAALLRRADKPLILVANKAEGRVGAEGAQEAFNLGFGDPIALSAEHGEGLGDLYDALRVVLPEAVEPSEDEIEQAAAAPLDDEEDSSELDPSKPLRVAVIGRPNAGKSTLLNRVLGEDRLLTGPEAGITRDAIGVDLEWRDRKLKMFDTAGLRKRARVDEKLEKLAGADALRAAKFAEVVVLLIDATAPFEKQDLTLADLIAREGRALVVGLNKWDLVQDRSARLKELREEAGRLLPQLKGMPIVPVSGSTGDGIDALMAAVFGVHETWNRRIATGRLNRWLAAALAANPPPAVAGRRIKIRYITQLRARPPYFVIFGNQLEHLPESYKRFLINGIRETFDLKGVPIRLSVRTSENPYEKKGRG
jgi:GTPase